MVRNNQVGFYLDARKTNKLNKDRLWMIEMPMKHFLVQTYLGTMYLWRKLIEMRFSLICYKKLELYETFL